MSDQGKYSEAWKKQTDGSRECAVDIGSLRPFTQSQEEMSCDAIVCY